MQAVLATAVGIRTAPAQACTDTSYRWTMKTDESVASVPAVAASIRSMLTTWALLPFTRESRYQCAPRTGRELKVYSVLGWVRRVMTDEDDRDWHVELTARRDWPADSCIVAEIPAGDLGADYAQARMDLQHVVSWNSQGDVAQPVRLRFIGAAFFDGQHRGGATRRDQTDGNHGRCNASARALWEIHPVYWVRQP